MWVTLLELSFIFVLISKGTGIINRLFPVWYSNMIKLTLPEESWAILRIPFTPLCWSVNIFQEAVWLYRQENETIPLFKPLRENSLVRGAVRHFPSAANRVNINHRRNIFYSQDTLCLISCSLKGKKMRWLTSVLITPESVGEKEVKLEKNTIVTRNNA